MRSNSFYRISRMTLRVSDWMYLTKTDGTMLKLMGCQPADRVGQPMETLF